MKIRLGFVSNSSSSSFCILFTKENLELAFKEMDRYEQEFVKQTLLGGQKPDNIFGRELLSYGNLTPMDGEPFNDLYALPERPEDVIEEEWKKMEAKNSDTHEMHTDFKKLLRRKPEDVFEW